MIVVSKSCLFPSQREPMFLISYQKPISAVLALLLLTGQLFASAVGNCGCSPAEAEVEQQSCCSNESTTSAASAKKSCCCGGQDAARSVCERPTYGCTCTESRNDEEKVPPAEGNRVIEQLCALCTALPNTVEGWSPKSHRSHSHVGGGRVAAVTTQVLFCVWLT